jgi:hypothetical protein
MSHTFELVFEFTRGYHDTQTQAWLPFAPFNAGTWRFRYSEGGNVTFECEGATNTSMVESVRLTTRLKNVPGYERSEDSGVHNGAFPPAPNWSLGCSVYSRTGNSPPCVARLIVTYGVHAPLGEGPREACVAQGEAVAKRAIGSYSAVELAALT